MGYAEAQYTVDEVLGTLKKDPIAGLVPNDLKNLSIIAGEGIVQITFTPSDTIIDGRLVCTMAGVIIRRKIGSAPTDEFDGDLVADINGDALYSYETTPYTDSGLANEQTYYYRLFTYNHFNVINRSEKMIKAVTVGKKNIWGFHQDFTNLDPDSSITYIEEATGYTPMHTNKDTGTVTEGSWASWSWLQQNLPYMVNKDGTVGYQLDPNDYTKKLDGTASDVNNRYYEGGAFAWLPKLYMKEVYAADGNSRDVYFALGNDSVDTADFHLAPGFVNKLGQEVEGVWLPMFYVATQAQSCVGFVPVAGKTLTAQLNTLNTFSTNAAALGGPIMNTLRDIFYLLYRSTNIQEKGGYGNSKNSSVVGNTVVGGGRFYGTSDGKSLNKALHSTVLFGYNLLLGDPYTYKGTDGYLYFNTHYTYQGTNTKTAVVYNDGTPVYPSKLIYCDDAIGSVPVEGTTGSSSTGLCDAIYAASSNTAISFPGRLGYYYGAEQSGPAYSEFTLSANVFQDFLGHATVILPVAGYSPAA